MNDPWENHCAIQIKKTARCDEHIHIHHRAAVAGTAAGRIGSVVGTAIGMKCMLPVAAVTDNPHQDIPPAAAHLTLADHIVAVVALATMAAGMVEVMRLVLEVQRVAAGMGL